MVYVYDKYDECVQLLQNQNDKLDVNVSYFLGGPF